MMLSVPDAMSDATCPGTYHVQGVTNQLFFDASMDVGARIAVGGSAVGCAQHTDIHMRIEGRGLNYFAEVSAFELLDGMDSRLTLAISINSVTTAKLIFYALGDRCTTLSSKIRRIANILPSIKRPGHAAA